jgi:hypothetical protein
VNYVSAASPAFTGVPTAPTAADGTNTTQLATTAFANAAGGLVYITSATIGTAVSSVTVSSCFSSTYDNYVVTIANPVFSVTAGTIGFTFNGLTSGYYGSQSYDLYTGGNNGYNRMNNATNFYVGITATDNASAAVITLYAPNKSLYHMFTSSFYGSGYTGIASGQTVDQTARTGFVITPSSGTITGGTITVYGYRK